MTSSISCVLCCTKATKYIPLLWKAFHRIEQHGNVLIFENHFIGFKCNHDGTPFKQMTSKFMSNLRSWKKIEETHNTLKSLGTKGPTLASIYPSGYSGINISPGWADKHFLCPITTPPYLITQTKQRWQQQKERKKIRWQKTKVMCRTKWWLTH